MPDSPIRVVQRGTGGLPLLYISTGEAGALAMRHLLRLIGSDQPVYSLVLARTPGYPFGYTVADLARIGIDELEAVHPSTGYVLAGYSMGGIVAYEMAQQLRTSGCSVPLLALVDAFLTAPPMSLQWLKREVATREKRPPVAQLAHLVRRAARSARRRVRPDRAGAPPPGGVRSEATTRLYNSYAPLPYPGRVLLIVGRDTVRARGRWIGWSYRLRRGWARVEVPGGHGTIMREPQVHDVAGALASAMREVAQRDTDPVPRRAPG